MWRALEVGPVVASLPFHAELVAGRAGSNRMVRRANPLSGGDASLALEQGDLVITSTVMLPVLGDRPADVIAALDAAQVAGVAVAGDGDVPAELLAAADRVGLAIVRIPDPVSLAEATAAVFEALLQAQGRRLDHVLAIHQRFAHVVAVGGGIADVAETLHEVLGAPVAVVDAGGTATVVVPDGAEVDVRPGSAAATRQPIRAGRQDYGAVVVGAPPDDVDEDGSIAIERAALAIGVHLAQAAAVAQAHERFEALSLEELVTGHGGSAADVAERAATFGWDLHRPRAVLLASIDPPEHGPLPDTALANIAAAARATLGPDAIVWTRSATIGALIAPDSDDPAERRALAEALRAELDRRVRSVTVSIGVGRRVAGPGELPRSFAEAGRAVEVGRWAKGRHVTEVFDQLGLERLLASTPTDHLVEFVRHAIGELVAHDRTQRTELVDTLAVWLETRNMAEAARRMYVHYNTLKNRLDRIEAIIGPVVADAARALECEVAIYVARHYDVPWEVPGEV